MKIRKATYLEESFRSKSEDKILKVNYKNNFEGFLIEGSRYIFESYAWDLIFLFICLYFLKFYEKCS